ARRAARARAPRGRRAPRSPAAARRFPRSGRRSRRGRRIPRAGQTHPRASRISFERMSSASTDRQQPIWTPSEQARASTELAAYMRWAGERHHRDFEDYGDLWAWSVEHLEDFWADIWAFGGVRASRPYERVLASREMPGTRWFEGAQLNYAENLLRGALPAP